MFYFILSIHILLCAVLIGLVLIQQGKGADLGPALGGGSNTLFGASGATAIVVKATTIAAVLFMLTSIFLVKHYRTVVSQTGQSASVEDRLQGSLLEAELAKAEKENTNQASSLPTSTPSASKGEAPAVEAVAQPTVAAAN
jgi:preprotein translocase subunit SecG